MLMVLSPLKKLNVTVDRLFINGDEYRKFAAMHVVISIMSTESQAQNGSKFLQFY